ncbi:hypothetical protein TcasGA2_TC011970 [Tribolium castaneum]|uniref:Uncharacterized protein n=1 Tax=Tribolium castaneum TaxID=7070 RepID=D6X2Y8_TRICA|nr:hypothetical protein TcasGA2_TC011970 [Tribolium castaneum]
MNPTSTSLLSPKKNSTLEDTFQNVVLMTEIGMDLKERCNAAEKYMTHLKLLLSQATRAIETLHSTSKYSLLQAKKLLSGTNVANSNANTRHDYEKLLGVIDRQLSDFDDLKDIETESEHSNSSYISEKIKFLESKQKLFDHNLPPSGSNKSVKCDIDEKYPESWSRDSSIDLNNVVNLPPVPEDVFTSFTNKPKRSSSLSSLKSMRKVKLFLQRAEYSDEDDLSSDNDELAQKGDSDEGSSPKKFLGNIKEDQQY